MVPRDDDDGDAAALARFAQLDLPADRREGLLPAYRRTCELARQLAVVNLGDTEPATQFAATRQVSEAGRR